MGEPRGNLLIALLPVLRLSQLASSRAEVLHLCSTAPSPTQSRSGAACKASFPLQTSYGDLNWPGVAGSSGSGAPTSPALPGARRLDTVGASGEGGASQAPARSLASGGRGCRRHDGGGGACGASTPGAARRAQLSPSLQRRHL